MIIRVQVPTQLPPLAPSTLHTLFMRSGGTAVGRDFGSDGGSGGGSGGGSDSLDSLLLPAPHYVVAELGPGKPDVWADVLRDVSSPSSGQKAYRVLSRCGRGSVTAL